MKKRIGLVLSMLFVGSSMMSLSLGEAESTGEERAVSADVLSTHKTVAVLLSIEERPCMGRTALCPDRCGHASKLAKFQILNYVEYDKLGEYGDAQQKIFYMPLSGNQIGLFQDKEIIPMVEKLKVGQLVVLNWDHLYVTDNGSKFPMRPVTLIEPILNLQREPIIIEVPKVDPSQPKAVPLPALQ